MKVEQTKIFAIYLTLMLVVLILGMLTNVC
jgi:hypothetical protein